MSNAFMFAPHPGRAPEAGPRGFRPAPVSLN
jgi:hypothetical protein